MAASPQPKPAWMRALRSAGIVLLVGAGAYYAWSSSIVNPSRLRGEGVAIHSSSGELRVLGTEGKDVHVTIQRVGEYDAARARIRIDRSRNPIQIQIDDIPQGAIALVEVPHAVSLAVSMTAGRIEISNIDGDKLCLLRSGEMVIDVGDPGGYRSARGFVLSGEVDAPAFHAYKGGLWRMVKWNGPGTAVVDAHVSAGRLELR